MHLGSFSAMTDVGEYFSNVGRTPTMSSPQQLPPTSSDPNMSDNRPSSSSGEPINAGVAGLGAGGAGGGGFGNSGGLTMDPNRGWRQQQNTPPSSSSNPRRASAQSSGSGNNNTDVTATRVDVDQLSSYPFATTALASSIEAANDNRYATLPPGAKSPHFRSSVNQPIIVTSPSRTASRSSTVASPNLQQRNLILESPVQASMSIASSATAFNSTPKTAPDPQDVQTSDFDTIRSKPSPTQSNNVRRSATGSPQYPQQRSDSPPSQQQLPSQQPQVQNVNVGLPPPSPRLAMAPSPYQPTSAPPPRPMNQSSPYPSFPSVQQAAQAQMVQQMSYQQQRRPINVPQMEEVCIECMMRDRDMADVDVTGEKVWERESDIWYEELIAKDLEDEVNARMAGVDLETYLAQQRRMAEAKGEEPPKPRPRSKAGLLTEDNLKVWLTMNPKEPQARWQTLQAYVTSQSALLAAESRARSEAIRESKLIETRLRDSYAQIRRSAYEHGATHVLPVEEGPSPGAGVRVKAPRSISGSGWPTNPATGSRRDLTLLENGMIVERVDVKKEEREERQRLKKEEKQWRRMSSSGGLSASFSVPNGDGSSLYSGGAPSPTMDQGVYPYGTNSFGVPPSSPGMMSSNASMRRLSTTSLSQLNPPRPAMHRINSSQASVETAGAGTGVVKRFFGYKHWGGASQTSLAISGSVANMHVELDQERSAGLIQNPPNDRSAPASLEYANDAWNQQGQGQPSIPAVNGVVSDNEVHTAQESSVSGGGKAKKKSSSRGLGKLWKIMTGQSRGGHGSHADDASMLNREKASIMASQEEDLSAPLAPPPPLSYIISNRSDRSPHSRHLSGGSTTATPGGQAGPQHSPSPYPRPASGAPPSSTGVSPPTAPSSLLPSPTSNRFTGRDSSVGSEDRRSSAAIRDDIEVDLDTSEGGLRRSTATGFSGYDQGGLLKVPNRPPSTASFSAVMTANSTPRPFTADKNLPPLPHESHLLNPGQRPNTVHVGGPIPESMDFSPPTGGPFRGPGEGMRRQSFSGMTGRLNSQAQQGWNKTIGPAGGFGITQKGPGADPYGALAPPVPVGARYDEFGGSRMSLGKYEDVRGYESYSGDANKRSTKTKSRFGFGSLFSKKHQPQPSFDQQFYQQHAFPTQTQDPSYHSQSMSHSSFYEAGIINGNGDLRKSVAGTRSSVASSKSKMVGLVTQDDDFVAYRYPSTEAALSPLR
ncbi:hypothetical protein FRC03_001732 [Tulasnella sp. 419]|nr:hypothetical protein FRC03_001732 [Tulasnella sp. 419]